MAYQTVFKRYELKYLLTERQKKCVMEAMEPCMAPDAYGRTTIRNIYFDTADYRLARRSIEKPVYKEKLRIRSYEKASGASPVFVELKKKYKGVVYKRRISMPEREAMEWTTGETDRKEDSQISREIGYFLRFYGNLRPAGFLTYQREAFWGKEQKDFRITFDRLVLFRQEDISLESDVYGMPVLPAGMTLMEIKCSGGIPLWMARLLSRERIYKTSFSKYGTAYKNFIFPTESREVRCHA